MKDVRDEFRSWGGLNFWRGTMVGVVDRDELIKQARAVGASKAEAQRQYARLMNDEVWVSTAYQVNVETMNSPLGEIIHLSIKRRDKGPIRDWRDMQAIKNALVGPEREAVELYPAESRVIDCANQYHLWVVEEGMKFPFGYDDGRVVTDSAGMGETQRPLTTGPVGPEALTNPSLPHRLNDDSDNPPETRVVGTHREPITIVDEVTPELPPAVWDEGRP